MRSGGWALCKREGVTSQEREAGGRALPAFLGDSSGTLDEEEEAWAREKRGASPPKGKARRLD